MVGMAERDGLFARFTLTGGIRGVGDQFKKCTTATAERKHRENYDWSALKSLCWL